MRLEIEIIKKGLQLLPSGLLDFVKKVFVFCFVYGRLFVFPLLFSFGLMQLLKLFGVSLDICTMAMKIGLIIGQIIPAASYAGVVIDDPDTEGSMDICFSGWIIISILIWYNL